MRPSPISTKRTTSTSTSTPGRPCVWGICLPAPYPRVVLPKGWKHTNKLVSAIKNQLSKEKDRLAYYPKSSETLNSLKESKHITQENDLSCSTPHLTKDLELNDYFEQNEVWSSTLFFKYII